MLQLIALVRSRVHRCNHQRHLGKCPLVGGVIQNPGPLLWVPIFVAHPLVSPPIHQLPGGTGSLPAKGLGRFVVHFGTLGREEHRDDMGVVTHQPVGEHDVVHEELLHDAVREGRLDLPVHRVVRVVVGQNPLTLAAGLEQLAETFGGDANWKVAGQGIGRGWFG